LASRTQQARNARARALGFENDYQRRVASAQARGYSRSQARGHAGVSEVGIRVQDRMLAALPGAVAITAMVRNPRGAPRDRRFEVDVIDAKGKATRFSFDVRAKGEVKALLADAEDVGAEIEGTP
jgi:hypothetical protein